MLASRGWWWKSLTIGSALWVIVAVVTFLTHNLILMPTLILAGSFLVPCTVALFAVEHASGTLTPWRIAGSFAIGGISGVLAASLLESRLVGDVWVYVRVGLIEELVKGAILGAVLFRALARRDGWRSTASVVVCYAAVVVLHALWDSMAGIAQILAMLVTGAGWHFYRYAGFFAHVANPGAATAAANTIYPLGLAVVAFAGVSILQLGPGRLPAGRSTLDARENRAGLATDESEPSRDDG